MICVVLVRYITNSNHGKQWRFAGTIRNGIYWAVKKPYNKDSHQDRTWDWFMAWITHGSDINIVVVVPSQYL